MPSLIRIQHPPQLFSRSSGTSRAGRVSGVERTAGRTSRSQTSLERMPSSQFEGLVRRTSSSDAPARRSAQRSADGSRAPTASSLISAGVAQLVERQPSKLNVASSNLVSRSLLPGSRLPGSRLPGSRLPGSRALGLQANRPANDAFLVPSGGHSGLPDCSVFFVTTHGHNPRVSPAHLAQLVEHVLGKDEVISSILMVGSSGVRVPPQKLSIACACGVLRSAAA